MCVRLTVQSSKDFSSVMYVESGKINKKMKGIRRLRAPGDGRDFLLRIGFVVQKYVHTR